MIKAYLGEEEHAELPVAIIRDLPEVAVREEGV